MLERFWKNIDWVLLLSILPIILFGLLTMNSFTEANALFGKQIIWVGVSLVAMFFVASFDFRFLKQTSVLVSLFILSILVLIAVLVVGEPIKGAKSWFDFGPVSFEPIDFVKLVLILMLAKYFSRRHVEIAHYKHIIVSGIYVFIPVVLVLLQPDFGSAMVLLLIWLGMIVISGVSKKHLFLIFAAGLITFGLLWTFAFKPYQKDRIISFLNPLTDIRGSGYNAYQSTIAVGSGGIFGKGVGYGTQSRLNFLPEYETDFIFAAFAEEWGFIGILLFFLFMSLVFWRMLSNSLMGATNFEILYGVGLSVFFMSHVAINIGMNIGLFPVTGLPIPFMSYGGSHLLAEFVGLGILMSMKRNARATHPDSVKNEFLGI